MEMCFGSRGISNYLDIHIGSAVYLSEKGYMFQVEMLRENEILNLIKPSTVETDGDMILRYETGCMYVLGRFFQKIKPDGKLLRLLINQILECSAELEKYLLSMEDLVIDPDYMFYDYGHRSLKLVCVPGYNRNLREQMKHFLEYIMQIFDHRDREGLLEMYSFYDNISTGGMLIQNDAEMTDNKNIRPVEEKNCTGKVEDNAKTLPEFFETDKSVYRLVPLTNGSLSDIILEDNVTQVIIGRGKKESDYRLKTTQISRIHACIYRRKEGIFIEDRESTNGTFLNAVRIPAMEQKKLNRGDIVGFANEEFFVS